MTMSVPLTKDAANNMTTPEKSEKAEVAARHVLCVGAGPAGLTAAYLLSKRKIPVTVTEADPMYLGGISKTVSYKGFLCDIGGHRFYTKSAEVRDLWDEFLGEDFLRRPRKSRIHYRGKLFDYPLRIGNILRKLSPIQLTWCMLSYLRVSLFPIKNPRNFEEFVTNYFGRRIFQIFFKTYTEKVWGMKCSEISADWAAQRIKGLTLGSAIRSMLSFGGKSRPVIKTLIDSFHYPRKGPGMMWQSVGRKIEGWGGSIEMGCRAVRLRRLDGDGWEVVSRTGQGAETRHKADVVVSSVSLRELVAGIEPAPPPEVVAAADGLRYRDHLTVGLIVKDRNVFDDQWIYIHDPDVKVGRIQNFKSWSPEMVPTPDQSCYGMEYFCFEGDGLWASEDADLVKRATRELVQLGLARPDDVTDGFVVRQEKAYPIYDDGYVEKVKTIRRFLESACPGLYPVGRNGLHNYNSQDHSMMTAMLTVENIVCGEARYDVWKVNQDAEYAEEYRESDDGGRLIPRGVEGGGD